MEPSELIRATQEREKNYPNIRDETYDVLGLVVSGITARHETSISILNHGRTDFELSCIVYT